MTVSERGTRLLLLALVLWLPFEFVLFPLLSNLQWLFLALAVVALPTVLRNRRILFRDRLILAAFVFVLTQWLAAVLADEFGSNALKAAARVTCGFVLLCVTLCVRDRSFIAPAWSISAILAAAYGILDYSGLGMPDLFRREEFFVGDTERLSGSFEYPNTAAAFLAMSLPLLWGEAKHRRLWVMGSPAVWAGLLLTYSRAATAAVLIALLVWAGARRSRGILSIAASVTLTLAALQVFSPFGFDVFLRRTPERVLAAEYEPEFSLIKDAPSRLSNLTILVTNSGTAHWLPDEPQPVSISYRWYDPQERRMVRVDRIHTRIPRSVSPGESIAITAPFHTPQEPGRYLLIWEMARRGNGWFNTPGMFPGIVEAEIEAGNPPQYGRGDVARWKRPENASVFLEQAPVARTDLWRAAIEMAAERPALGVGPDNFRLLYGRRSGLSSWDTKIHANNLYLELLAGSGLIGLGAFLVLMACVRWSLSPPAFAVGVFLIHGLADVFLMTTPVYFAFWILLGHAHDRRSP